MSRNVPMRMKQLRIQYPFRFKLIHVIPTDDVIRAENMLHAAFEACRLRPSTPIIDRRGKIITFDDGGPPEIGTEWFCLSVRAIQCIRSIVHMYFPKYVDDPEDPLRQVEAWNTPTIPYPEIVAAIDQSRRADLGYSHYGYNIWQHRRIELLDEHDFDKFWSQFFARPASQETHQAPPQPEI